MWDDPKMIKGEICVKGLVGYDVTRHLGSFSSISKQFHLGELFTHQTQCFDYAQLSVLDGVINVCHSSR